MCYENLIVLNFHSANPSDERELFFLLVPSRLLLQEMNNEQVNEVENLLPPHPKLTVFSLFKCDFFSSKMAS